jgi:poly-gamma-glutamate capsule biosynthesis protein CapA/YwtB (metallophosphatase superfamily)
MNNKARLMPDEIRWTIAVLLCLFIFSSSLAQDTTRLSLVFAGDIMQHDSQITSAYDPLSKKYDYTSCFQFIAPLIQAADVAIGNLELTLAGPPYKGYPQFSAPDVLAETLKAAGFDVLVTANNHCVDRGRKGLERTIDVLDTLHIIHTGTFKDITTRSRTYPLIIEKKGFRLSLLNYTYGTNGISVPQPNVVNQIDTALIHKDLIKAKEQNPDAIIVFFHWGSEYMSEPNVQQKALTEICFKQGAKLVIGSHPHVLQPMQWRKQEDVLVAFSLGNFVSGQRLRFRDGGVMVNVELEKVSHPDSLSHTSIKNASYDLEWVYKDSSKDSYILPLRDFENDSVFIKDETSRELIKQFARDSRSLFEVHNIGISESPALDSVYQVLLSPYDSTMNDHPLLRFYGWQRDSDTGIVTMGEFYDKDTAALALEEVKTKTAYREARLIGVLRRRK